VIAVTDPGFAAGVESQKTHVHGVVKGVGNESARVDYVPAGEKVERGEMFFTSGEDRVFPRGLPVGKVTSVKEGSSFQEIYLQPSGVESAPEEVLVIIDPVHQSIPEAPPADSPVFLAPDVKPGVDPAGEAIPAGPTTADKMMDEYKKIGEAQKHQFGEGGPGTPPPNFNLKVPCVNAPANAPGTPPTAQQKAAASGTGTPAGTGVKPPVTPAVKPPVSAAERPPVNTTVKPPVGTTAKLPEGTTARPAPKPAAPATTGTAPAASAPVRTIPAAPKAAPSTQPRP
jgi:rod shape-determining protein MreC